jgi:hypothetical protein
VQSARDILPADYARLLGEIKERIRTAQYAALRAVNRELAGLYWDIVRTVVGRHEGKSWGKAVVERLATDLRAEFPGVSGFSASNLWRMKACYEAYAGSEKLAPLVREIARAFQRRRTSKQMPECRHGHDPTCPEKPAGEKSDRMPGTRAECPVAENRQVAIGEYRMNWVTK